MKIAVLFSGGKDSVFTTYYYQQQGWDVCCLLTLVSANTDSWMFHTPNISLLSQLQAEALHIPLVQHPTSGTKEAELDDLRDALLALKQTYGIIGLAVGALASDYQHERVNRICHSLDLKCFAPLWHKNQAQLLKEMIDAGFVIIVQHVAADGLDASWLGKQIDHSLYEKLLSLHKSNSMHVAGEGGEYETLVLDGPNFYKSIVLDTITIEDTGSASATMVIKHAHLT